MNRILPTLFAPAFHGMMTLKCRKCPTARSTFGYERMQGHWDGEITAHGLRHSTATILLNHVGKNLREIQELGIFRTL